MKQIGPVLNKLCKERLSPYGFVRKNRLFLRIKNDVIHTCNLIKATGLPIYSVEFEVLPLCMEQPVYLSSGGIYRMDEFTTDHEKFGGWVCDPNFKLSARNESELLLDAIDTHLLPFFERCSSCIAALSEVLLLEELIDNNRKTILKRENLQDLAEPWRERALSDSRKYYMALKAGNYEFAREFLQHQLNVMESQLRQSAQNTYRYHIEQLNAGNEAFFCDVVKRNEIQMRAHILKEYGIKID